MGFYDEIAQYYDMTGATVSRYREEARRMNSLFRGYQVETVLDLACGTGSHLVELARLGYRCTGRDMSAGMLAVARQKAEQAGLSIQWLEGDMCVNNLDRTFDAVLGLYAFTTLVEDEHFLKGLTCARQAVRDKGLFYFNLLNADSQGVNKGDCGPVSYLDGVVDRPGIRLVRLNRAVFKNNVQDWTHIYLVDEGQGLFTIVGNHTLRFHHLDRVQEALERTGFEIKDVSYCDVQGMEKWDMFILAQAN